MKRTSTGPERTRAAVASALAFVVLAGAGCAASDPAGDDAPRSQATEAAATEIAEPAAVRDAVDGGMRLIDVRTPEEFEAGHLRGAVNIDLSAPDFEQRIGDLDRSAGYVVYCASGNRAGTAITTMRDQGFEDVVNGGGYEDLADAGLPATS